MNNTYMLSEFIKDLQSKLQEHGDIPVDAYTHSEDNKSGGSKNPENWIDGNAVWIDVCNDKNNNKHLLISI